MEPLRYHRQLSRSIYIWGIFTPRDFALLIAGLAADMVTLESNLVMLVLLVAFPAYLAAFRLGRAPGYDIHLLRAWVTPRHFRPGREERPYPSGP